MFRLKNLFVVAAVLLTVTLNPSTARAESQACFTTASLQGSYAIVGNYGANVAVAFGVRVFDGQGGFTGHYVLNAPTPGDTNGARTISAGAQVGTYTINCDGSGVITRTLTKSDGTTYNQTDNFLITKGSWQLATVEGVMQQARLALSVVDAQTTPSALIPGGVFLTRSWTRQSDKLGD